MRENKEKEPLVIKVDGRNGWRERLFGPTRAKKSWLPDEVRAQREAEENQAQGQGRGEDMQGVEVEGPSTKFGLTYAEVKEPKLQKTVETTTTTSATEVKKEVVVMEVDSEPAVENKELSQEEAALQALIRESKGEAAEQRSNLIIKSQAEPDNDTNMGYDETRSFRDDVSRRPEPASLAAYAAVPVEQFGAALLRGMGWKEGQPVGRGRYSSSSSSQQQDGSLAPRIPERRPGYLGIGAKDLSGKAGSAELELGAWGKAAMRKAKPGEGLYTPVLMKNKKTGEMMTEEDFKKLAKEQEKEKEKKEKDDEWKERRDKNLSKNGRRYDDGDDDYKRSRESSSRRNGHGRSRSSSADGHRDRDRDRRRDKRYEDNYEDQKTSDYDAERRRRDDRRYRDRDYKRERGDDARGDRDKDRDRNRDWDRTRSKYDDSGKDKDRDRYKERERDRNRDRDRRRDYR